MSKDNKRSFFERLTGAIPADEYEDEEKEPAPVKSGGIGSSHTTSTGHDAKQDARQEIKNKSMHMHPKHMHHNGSNGSATRDLKRATPEWPDEEPVEGQLTVDVYQTPDDIIIRTMVAGVKNEDLDIAITRDMVTIKGSRSSGSEAVDEDYFCRELYWGSFSRTITLPEEIKVEEAEAIEDHGLLTIRLPKIDKGRQTKLKVRSR